MRVFPASELSAYAKKNSFEVHRPNPGHLLTLPRPENGRHYELSGGELIRVGIAGARPELVKGRILKALFAYLARHANGIVFSESQFTLAEDTARIPDVAFVGTAKVELLPEADVPISLAPDLAVEVISDPSPPPMPN